MSYVYIKKLHISCLIELKDNRNKVANEIVYISSIHVLMVSPK